ncbi:MAG: hypothetical protein JWM11_20 [Planctomycetaceae bacterium]|nr:hypothetical protein [Planctomycetaceae bacterium]
MTTSYIFEHLAVIFFAATGVWAARGKSVDLFGVIVLGLVTSMGGGTIRDLLLDVPVFWIVDSTFLISSIIAAALSFFMARYFHPPRRLVQIPDAFGLAFVTMLGASKTHLLGHAGPVCVVLGVTSGVAGGILRDVLSGEIPLVFRPHIFLYATAAAIGAVIYVLVVTFFPQLPGSMLIGAAVILTLRLAAVRWQIRLPIFRTSDL